MSRLEILGPILGVSAFFASVQFCFYPKYQSPFPTVQELLAHEETLKDFGAVALGLRRLGADLAYIQMLQYYGTPENAEGHGAHETEEVPHDHYEDGSYPQLLSYGQRILRLDPYFQSALLYISGALAFNLSRPDEGLDLLVEAFQRDPTFWRYSLYIGAIGYAKLDKSDQMISLLEQARKYPDCPALVKNILGNIYKKQGRIAEAINVFQEILETSRDENYRALAKVQLEKLQSLSVPAP